MPENISEAFDAPIVETVGGEQVSFARPTIDDLAKWAEEIHGKRRAIAAKLMPKDLSPPERFHILSAIEHNVPGLADVQAQLYTVPGARQMYRLSLAKSGVARADADRIIARIPPLDFVKLALRISGLVKFVEAEAAEGDDDGDKAKGDADPNDEAGE